MHLKLVELLKEAAHSLIYSECAVSSMDMMQMESDRITDMVRHKLVLQLAKYVVENQILNDPDCLQMVNDMYEDKTRYRARIYMLPPAQLKALMKKAYEAGRSSAVFQYGAGSYP